MCADHREHRGPHPEDEKWFAFDQLPALRQAVFELSWLLSRGYQLNSSLKLVGDRHGLRDRQRLAVSRAACSDQSLTKRTRSCLSLEMVHDNNLVIDGFNLIITLEAALSRGVLLLCRDGCLRDMSSVHGSYRSVQETEQAIKLVGHFLETKQPHAVHWFLDKPISNSGRLAQKIRGIASHHHWPWTVELVFNPDQTLISSHQLVISSDAVILDKADQWVNLCRSLVEKQISNLWLLDFSIQG